MDGANCPRCLDSEEWQSILTNEVGLGSAARIDAFQPWIILDNWLSHEITGTITMILLREAMGVAARGATLSISGNVEMICCSEQIVSMESWGSDFQLNETSDPATATEALGYTGQSNYFLPPYTVQQYPLAFTYEAFRHLDDYKHIFPPAFSTACENMTMDDSLGCTTGNFACELNSWSNTTCHDSKWYVPPQCATNNNSAPHCQEIFLDQPDYETGILEGMIKNNGLNMTIAYIGDTRYTQWVLDMVARKQNFMFYWWQPDPMISRLDLRQVQFDAVTAQCKQEYNSDPTLNTATCGFPKQTLMKRTQTKTLFMDSDFEHFFRTFQLSDDDIDALLAQHTSGGGNKTSYEVSCAWVKSNFATWKEAVQNTPPVASPTSSSLSTGVIVALVLGPLVLVIAGLALCCYWCMARRDLRTRNAPTATPLAIIFTDIENSTMLWETCGEDMSRAVELHHTIIRGHIDEFGAYEVKIVGDSFMIACGSLGDAALLCLAIQTSLGQCTQMPSAMRFLQSVQSSSRRSLQSITSGDAANIAALKPSGFNYPLRVRIGLHWCCDVNAQIDAVHGRYDYYGHDVNVCARVESQAEGGQILMSEATYEVLKGTEEFALAISPDAVIIPFTIGAKLKGVSEPVTLIAMAPATEVASGYVPAKCVKDTSATRTISGISVRTLSTGFSTGHQSTDSTSTTEQHPATSSHEGTAGPSADVSISSKPNNASRYAASLLRTTFRAVPDTSKKAWLEAVARDLRIPLAAEAASQINNKKQLRMEWLKTLKVLQAAVEEDCNTTLGWV